MGVFVLACWILLGLIALLCLFSCGVLWCLSYLDGWYYAVFVLVG